MYTKFLFAAMLAVLPMLSWAQSPVRQSLSGKAQSRKSYQWTTTATGDRVYVNERLNACFEIPKEFVIREEFDYSGFVDSPDSWGIDCYTSDRRVKLTLTFSGESIANDYKFYLDQSESYRPTSLHKLTRQDYYLSGYRYLRPANWEDSGEEIIFYRKGVVLPGGTLGTVEVSCSPEDSRTVYKNLVGKTINRSIKNFPGSPSK